MFRSGPGGFEGLGAVEGLKRCHELGLDAAEIEFTYGVNMSNETAKEVGALAKALGVSLSVHAPYYINLASEEPEKIEASKKRILDSVERGHHLGAEFVVFHAAFYGKRTPQKTFEMVKDAVAGLMAAIKRNAWSPRIAAETTGKPSQFGSLDELRHLAKETGCAVCVDFAHLRARNNGVVDYDAVCVKVKGIEHVTGHFSGIQWSEKGEKRHIPTEEALVAELLSYLKKHGISIRLINESPQPMDDAVMTMRLAKKGGLA